MLRKGGLVLVSAAALLGLLAPAPAAAAAEPAEVESLIKRALDLRREGKDALAYPLLQQAHELGSTPRTAAQLGMVEINLGYWLQAERHLTEALAAQRNPWVHQHRAVLEQSLARARAAIGEVMVVGTPEGAEVLVNGAAAGKLPLGAPVRVGEGTARVELRAPGHVPARRSVNVVGGKQEQLAIALEREAAPSPVTPPVGPAPQLDTAAAGTGVGPWARPTAWALGGVAAGALGFAVFQTVRWNSKRVEFDEHRPDMAPPGAMPDCGAKDLNKGGPGCADIHAAMESARNRAVMGYVATGLLAAGSATLFILSRRSETGAVACAPLPGLSGAGCRVTF